MRSKKPNLFTGVAGRVVGIVPAWMVGIVPVVEIVPVRVVEMVPVFVVDIKPVFAEVLVDNAKANSAEQQMYL